MPADLDTLLYAPQFRDPLLSRPATYLPAVAAPVTCRLVWKAPDAVWQSGTGTGTPARVAKLRQAEVPSAAEGDRLLVGGITYPVLAVTVPDPDRLLWQLELGDPA